MFCSESSGALCLIERELQVAIKDIFYSPETGITHIRTRFVCRAKRIK